MGIGVGDKPQDNSFQVFEVRESRSPLSKHFPFLGLEKISARTSLLPLQSRIMGFHPKGVSDRIFRFEKMEAQLRRDNRPETFHFLEDEIPEYYLRMRSAVRAIRAVSSAPILVMDTAFSAILGCLDETQGPSLVVNVGNGHTMAAFLLERKIEGLYEHHTHALTPEKLEEELGLFVKGELKSDRVYEESGHGTITLKPYDGEISVIVTGPNRDLFKRTSMRFAYAAPGGNTMMTGPVGLVKAALFRLGSFQNRD